MFGGDIMDYFITQETLLIMPITKTQTKILENDNVMFVDSKTFKIVNDNCKLYGSTYLNRVEFSKTILKCRCKMPIILDNDGNIILFPTTSKRQEHCAWLNYNNIKSYKEQGSKNVVVTFLNGIKIVINMSYYTFEHQINKCHRLKLDYLEKKVSIVYKNAR